jgi:pentatricopeptide repeat protein
MPIYSNLYSNLARQGFAKTFTHGYAQSVVAATHPSSYPNQHHRSGFGRRLSRPGKLSSYQFQNAFHTSVSSSSTAQDGHKLVATDGGLDAYFDAWKKGHPAGEPEKEWTQFQFAKRIEWTPSSSVVELAAKEEAEVAGHALAPPRVTLDRAYSTSAIDDLQKGHNEEAESIAIDVVDYQVADEIKTIQTAHTQQGVVTPRVSTPPVAPFQSPALTVESTIKSSPASSATSASNSDLQSQTYAEHLTKLSDARRYAEIPAVFEAMLVAGIQPIAIAYNALLDAAINLPTERIQVVPKALDVYSDMLRRKVLPNTTTYNTLLSLLASRTLEVSTLKKTLEAKRLRFGGMEEAGKFMLASSEMEFDILSEEDRLDVAMKLFDASIASRHDRVYPAETYFKLISACSETARVSDMVRLYDHMESRKVIPLGATFPSMIQGFAASSDLVSAVECYNEYKSYAIADNRGLIDIIDRQDASVYATVVKSYVISDKMAGAEKFYEKIVEAYEPTNPSLKDTIVSKGFVQGMLDRGILPEALRWAEGLQYSAKVIAMSKIATAAADAGDKITAVSAFENIPLNCQDVAVPAMALLALSIRAGDLAAASRYWQMLSTSDITISSAFVEPTAMYAVALIGSGQVADGLLQSEQMFRRIKESAIDSADEVDEGIDFIAQFMAARGITDPRSVVEETFFQQPTFPPTPYGAPLAQPAFEDSFDPYAASTDFKGSSLITDELERGSSGRGKVSRLNEALARFRNIRRAGRHPRYITYAKLISAAAREDRMNLVHDLLGMARSDIPLLTQYPVVRYGWVSILDAMVGACLTVGNRTLAARYHQELLDMGAAPTANTFGLYITTLKESTKTFDEASEAVKIFHRAKSEGVEPSSFLYNALIGKLGKARRIDDCLFYFAEMRSLGIRPTSVTYGTIVNALCRVSDEKFAEELFEEMESMPNYKARPAPYNSLMQFFLTTKRDKAKVLAYYERMKSKGIQPTNHTYKLLVDTHATLEPVNMDAAEAVLDVIRSTGQKPEAVHYSSLIHAKGCVLHDIEGARAVFDSVLADPSIRPQACLYQALFEAMVANHRVSETEPILRDMSSKRVEMTPYIANTLIHGWANEMNIEKSKAIFASVSRDKREPSTYEAMTRAFLAVEDRPSARNVVQEMLSRGYPNAVSSKILELIGGGNSDTSV